MKIFRCLVCLMAAPLLAYADETPDYRLPAGISPVSQTIDLKLDPSEPAYSGSTTINLDIELESARIGINQVGLTLTSITLSADGVSRPLEATESEWERNWLSDGKPISPGEYQLTIEFEGEYSTDSLGMHRVSFEDRDYIFTQFESMYARRAFPAFDEPSFKIPYQINISAPAGMAVLTNTPEDSREESDGMEVVSFMQTPPMSSYYLAIAVGPLDRAEISGMSVPGFVYTPKGHADEVGFVLKETPTIVATLEEYFGKSYPYKKLDFVAVPEFAFGAMENPGLIKYRTDLMMVGDEVSGTTAETVLMVIAHETAHIWYGDLVTMAWWDDLWLNEAFASWMARTVMERDYPQYDSNLKLPQAGAFPADQRTTTKPIRRTVRNNTEIFDGIGLNYTKGHSLLQMLENYVGPEVWQSAIRKYVEKYSWKNATEKDLWAVVSEESGFDISAIASSYLNQPGFATVSVSKDGTIEQKRYLTSGREAADLEWQIPINVKYKADGEVRQTFSLLKEKNGSLDVPANADWIFPDAGGNGYYRWSTDTEQFYNLVDDADALTAREKIALLDNSEALLNAGEMSLSDYMFVLNKLIQDPHPLVFLPTLENIKAVGEQIVPAESDELFSAFIDQAMTERFKEVGVDSRPGDSEALLQMRPRLVRTLGQFGTDESVGAAAAQLTNDYLASADAVQSRLALEAMRVTAMSGGVELYEKYISAYESSTSEDQKSNILNAIYFSDPDLIHRHLTYSISPAVPAGDAATALTSFAYLLDDYSVLYEWLDENMDAMMNKLPAYYGPAMPQVVSGNCNEKDLARLQEYFGSRGETYASSLAKAVESAESCIDRRNRYAADLQKFLEQYSDG